MSTELTPWPDGEGGFMENVWGGLSDNMRECLARQTGNRPGRPGERRRRFRITWSTHEALVKRDLLIRGEAWSTRPTQRGRDLANWARDTGRWSA